MSVRVIKKQKAIYTATCSHCFSKLEFEEDDPKYSEYYCCGKPESGEFLKCPACKKEFELWYDWRSTWSR